MVPVTLFCALVPTPLTEADCADVVVPALPPVPAAPELPVEPSPPVPGFVHDPVTVLPWVTSALPPLARACPVPTVPVPVLVTLTVFDVAETGIWLPPPTWATATEVLTT